MLSPFLMCFKIAKFVFIVRLCFPQSEGLMSWYVDPYQLSLFVFLKPLLDFLKRDVNLWFSRPLLYAINPSLVNVSNILEFVIVGVSLMSLK